MASGTLSTRSSRVDRGSWDRFGAWGAAFALAALAFIAWMAVRPGGNTLATDVDDIGEAIAAGVAAVTCALAGSHSHGRLRRAWLLLAASAASWCLGEVAWSVSEVGFGITPTSPALPDIGFLAAIPLAIFGITSFSNASRGTSTGLRLWLDRAIVSLSLLLVGWELGLGQVFSESGTRLLPAAIAVAYPIGDILIGTALILAIRRATDETQGRLMLLLAGLAANALADSAFVYANVEGNYTFLLDSGWVVGYLTIALAALWPSRESDHTADQRPIDMLHLILPWLAVLAGGLSALVAAILGHPLDLPATVLTGVVIALLMVSQVLAHRESLLLLIRSRLSAETLNDVIVHAPLGVVRIAPDLTILEVNPTFCAMLRTQPSDVVGAPVARFFPRDEMAIASDQLRALVVHEAESAQFEIQGTRADGSAIWLQWTVTTVKNRSGESDYFLVMFGDVSERRSTEDALKAAYAEMEGLVAQRTAELRTANERLSVEAVSDPLTGLYNRRHLKEFVDRELSRAQRGEFKIVFAMIDIDHFKSINDAYGHDAGDDVLRALSAFLRAQIRREDLPFRYGGEEFLLVMPSTAVDGVMSSIERLHAKAVGVLVENLDRPPISFTLSIGVAVFPDHGDSAEVVIRKADAALYLAKSRGRNRVVFHAGAPERIA